MEKVRLETSDGSLVGYTVIPSFKPRADVLIWGSRIFKAVETGANVYSECFAVAVVGEVTAE
jgi:hypothetical protein